MRKLIKLCSFYNVDKLQLTKAAFERCVTKRTRPFYTATKIGLVHRTISVYERDKIKVTVESPEGIRRQCSLRIR